MSHYTILILLLFQIFQFENNNCNAISIIKTILTKEKNKTDFYVHNLNDKDFSNYKKIKKRNILGPKSQGMGSKVIGLDFAKDKGLKYLEKAQNLFTENSIDCMPGSLFFNRSCYYFSRNSQKLTWIHAERFCRNLPLNTTMLVIKNNQELEFLKQAVIKLKQNENFQEQLVYYIGFNYTMGEWKWLNNETLSNRNSSINISAYWNESKYSLGKCGSIAVLEDNQVIFRSAPCSRTDERFICTYVLNPCYKNEVCGKHGRCVNLLQKTYCQCTSMFHEGKYCDKLNSRAIQSFIALVIILIIILFLVLSGRTSRELFSDLNECLQEVFKACRKNTQEANTESTTEKDKKPTVSSILNDKSKNSLKVKGRKGIKEIDRKPNMTKTLSAVLHNHFREHIHFYDNIILIIIMILLTSVQIVLIHLFKQTFRTSLKSYRQRNGTVINMICENVERKYLSEEVIYLIMSIVFITILTFLNRTTRFSNYIMRVYNNHMSTPFYKNILKKRKEMFKQCEKERLNKMNGCKKCCYQTKRNWFFKFLCCIFCWSCCVSDTNKSTHGCCYYCCIDPLKRTECCKQMICVKDACACICCCSLWCLIRRKIVKSSKVSQTESSKRTSISENDHDHEHHDNASDCENAHNTTIGFDTPVTSFMKWPLPFRPFSTTNRLQSVAIYVAYTYDVLNIFMYLYTAYLVTPIIPVVRERDGVLVDFLLQILQVLLIGFKFYPILAVADMKPNIFAYCFGFIYLSVMWVAKVVNKGFCSRSEAFLKFTLDTINDRIEQSKLLKINEKFNLSSLAIQEYNDEDSKYRAILRDKIPAVFEKFFGSNTQNLTQIQNSQNILKPTPQMQYYTKFTLSTLIPNNQTTSTLRSGFRKKIYNKTLTYAQDLLDGWQTDESLDWSTTIRNLLENLPLYLCLSYLVARYLLSTLELIIMAVIPFLKKCAEPKKVNKLSPEDKKSANILLEKLKMRNKSEDVNNSLTRDEICRDYKANIDNPKYCLPKHKPKNLDYVYIKTLMKNAFPLQNPINTTPSKVSYALHLMHKIYKPEKYFCYSKQFINTYTVAFMIIYFFTVFLLRMSNIFGNKLVRGIDSIYQFIFRGMMSSSTFSFENHNLFTEFALACLLTSFIIIYQLFLSIKNFKRYVLYLRKVNRDKDANESFINLWKVKKKDDINTMITSHSLHFPGYLIAHLVYGYMLLFCLLFAIVLILKFIMYFPSVLDMTTQIVLPLVILLLLKILSLKVLTRAVFLQKDQSRRITNLTPYYTMLYFNFFFDCFLGFLACLNRIWQTTVLSMIFLPRLDITIFNEQNDLILKQLDKGHLAYVNFVHMECMYNNRILNGFCDFLIEILFESNMHRYELNKDSKKNDLERSTLPRQQERDVFLIEPSYSIKSQSRSMLSKGLSKDSDILNSKTTNKKFNYKSYRHLCNIFNIYLLLRKDVSKKCSLNEYTIKNIKKRAEEKTKTDEKHESFKETFKRNINVIRSPSPSRRSRKSIKDSDRDELPFENDNNDDEMKKFQSDIDEIKIYFYKGRNKLMHSSVVNNESEDDYDDDKMNVTKNLISEELENVIDKKNLPSP